MSTVLAHRQQISDTLISVFQITETLIIVEMINHDQRKREIGVRTLSKGRDSGGGSTDAPFAGASPYYALQ